MSLVYTLVLHDGETHTTTDPTEFDPIMRDENALQWAEDELSVVFNVPEAIRTIKALKPGHTWRHSLGRVTCDVQLTEMFPTGVNSND